MSFVTSAPSFLQGFTSRGVFSAETAFQKPRVSNSASGFASQGFSKRIPMNGQISLEKNTKGVKAKHSIDNDESLFTLEPSKKLKVSCEKEFSSSDRLTAKRSNQTHSSVVKLTVAEVFGEPAKPCKSGKMNFFDDDDQNDDSSLSFISSSFSSLDHIEEEFVEARRKGSDFELDHHFKLSSAEKEEVHQRVTEPLVVRDNVLNSFKNKECINPDDVFIPAHMIDYSSLLPLTHYHTLQSSASLLQNLQAFRNIDLISQFGIGMPQLFGYNQQQSFYPQYPVQMMHEELFRSEQNKMNAQSRFETVKNEEGYDSDSQATKSTCIEGMDILNVGKYTKTSSSPFSNLSEVDEMEKNKPEIKKAKNNKKEMGKPKKETNKQSQPNKKKRGENLKLDVNPQQLKVERRLNRLQLLRYQQGEVEEEAPLFPVPVEEKKNVVESDDLFDLEQLQAEIPPFALDEQPVRRRRNIALKWNPEVMSAENVDDYIQRLSEAIQIPVTDQEGALKLLRSHNMDVNRVMEVVQEDLTFYRELFRLKVKRSRRR